MKTKQRMINLAISASIGLAATFLCAETLPASISVPVGLATFALLALITRV